MGPFKTTNLTTSQSATIGATLSAGGIVYASGGNSSLWNSSYNTSTNYQSTSSNFVYQNIISFTPTVGDWYRIITGSGMMGGTVRIGGTYNNQVTDVEFQFNMAGYGTGGSIQQTRFSSFNNGNVSQVRIGGNPSAGNFVYLDINVGGSSGAYAPLYITYTPNLGPYTGTLVTSPVSGATVFSTSAGYYYLLSLAHGFRTTNNVVGNLIQDSAGNSLELKANINSPTFTGTVGGITKTMVGLGNVDNTTDAAKPVSTAQQTALNLKANLASPTFTGTVTSGNITLNNNNLINGFIQNTLPETYSSNNGTTLTGTVYFADASAVTAGIVTGIGTAFLSELKVGDRVQNTSNTYFGGQVADFYVKSIQSNIQFTLSRTGGSQSTGSGSAFSAKRYRALFSVANQGGDWSFGITNDGAFFGGGALLVTLAPNNFNWGGRGVFTTGSGTGGVRGYSWESTGGWESFYTDNGSPNLYVGVPAGGNGSTAGLLTVGSASPLGSLGVYAKNASTVVASFKGAASQSHNYLNISSSSGTGDILTVLSSGNVGISTTTPNEKLTVSGNISATNIVYALGGNSSQWNSTYTTVQNNSASWEESADILPTVTNYLSTSNVLISGLNVTGDIVANRIQATVKNFYIKHPTKPDKHLVYSSLESPYNGVQLTGEDEVINGLCVVELPDYLNSLIHSDSVHIQLTNYQHSKSLHVEKINIDQNNFTVKCDSWFSKSQKLKFFWLLNGVRKDIERLETEV
jgi:hypothetical protein